MERRARRNLTPSRDVAACAGRRQAVRGDLVGAAARDRVEAGVTSVGRIKRVATPPDTQRCVRRRPYPDRFPCAPDRSSAHVWPCLLPKPSDGRGRLGPAGGEHARRIEVTIAGHEVRSVGRGLVIHRTRKRSGSRRTWQPATASGSARCPACSSSSREMKNADRVDLPITEAVRKRILHSGRRRGGAHQAHSPPRARAPQASAARLPPPPRPKVAARARLRQADRGHRHPAAAAQRDHRWLGDRLLLARGSARGRARRPPVPHRCPGHRTGQAQGCQIAALTDQDDAD